MTTITWHRGIGASITPDMSIDDQLIAARLDWEVETSAIRYADRYESEYKKAVYRTDTGELLDCCGKNWKPYQNKDLVETFHRFCEGTNLKIDHMGALEGGRVIFAGADLKTDFDVRNVGDVVSGRLLLFNFHKVGYGLQVKLQAERLICTNGMTLPVTTGSRIINHVKAFDSSKVEKILEAALKNVNEFESTATKLASTSMSVDQATLLLINEFGNPKLPIDQQPAVVETCLRLFSGGGMGSDLLSAYDTAWGLLNSVTEFFNHRSQVRNGTATHLSSLLLGSKARQQNQFYDRLVRVCAIN